MGFEELIGVGIRALGIGGGYAIMALGFNIVFASSGVFNFSQGELFIYGGFLGVVLLVSMGLPYPLVIALAVLTVMGIAGLQERFTIRPLVAVGSRGWIITTLGFGIGLRGIAEILWGTEPLGLPAMVPTSAWRLGSIIVVPTLAIVFVAAVTLTVGVDLFYRRTTTGKALTAIAQDRDAATLRGINVTRLILFSVMLSAAIVALGGLLFAPATTVYSVLGFSLLVKGFVAAAIGGLGSHRGGLVGGLMLGPLEQFGSLLVGAAYRDVLVFIVLLVVLFWRPQGLFIKRAVRVV